MKISTKFIILFFATATVAISATGILCLVQFKGELLRQVRIEQQSRMKAFHELLAQQGTPEVADGKLKAGGAPVSNALTDKMTALFGGTATVFVGESMVATTVLNDNGTRATGLQLDPAAYQAVKEGHEFRGEQTVLGEDYLSVADPLVDGRQQVIGALWIGVKKSECLAGYEQTRKMVIGIAVVVVLSISAIAAYLIRQQLRPLARLTAAASRIADGHQEDIVAGTGSDEIGTLAEAFNKMTTGIVENLKGEVGKGNRMFGSIREAIAQLSGTTRHITVITTQQASGAAEQAAAVQQITVTSAEIAATAKEITRNAKRVETSAEQTAAVCSAGSDDVQNATAGMARLKGQVQGIAASMLQLGENSQKIGGIVEIIDEISDRTNLLSLNAALEAAGAGESGKRFSVVAREVRRLAERTVEATSQIKALIEEIQHATNSTVTVTEQGTKAVDDAVVLVDSVRKSFTGIIGMVEETARSAKEIAFSTQQQTSACEQMADSMNEVRDVALQVAQGARETEHAIGEVVELTARLTELIETELQAKGKEQAKAGARLMENVLADLVNGQRFRADELFDEEYRPIAGTDPQKFHTCYDKVLDNEIQIYLDDFLACDDKVIYAILTDRNGYVPTHNTRFSQPLTGDKQKDRAWNRTKRLFNDPVGLAASRSEDDVLVQIYYRDTGEKIWDISAPVYLEGRHWGAFRISYTLEDQAG